MKSAVLSIWTLDIMWNCVKLHKIRKLLINLYLSASQLIILYTNKEAVWSRCEVKIAQQHRKWENKSRSWFRAYLSVILPAQRTSRWQHQVSETHVNRGIFLTHIVCVCVCVSQHQSQQSRWDFPMSQGEVKLLALIHPRVDSVSKNCCSVPVQ